MKLTLTLFGLLLMGSAFAQNPNTQEVPNTCYHKWTTIFEERGAFAVEDGLYEDVVVTIRKGDEAECFYGRVRMTEGKMSRIQIKFEDGTFTDLNKQYKHDVDVTVANGMSTSQITVDDEVVNVLFIMKIKPKKKAFAKADPEISDF